MLKDSLKFLAKDTAVYGISGAIAKFLAIFVVPLLTRALSPTEFGVFDAVQSFTLTFSAFIVLGQDSAIARYISEDINDKAHTTRVVTAGLFIQLLPLALYAILYIFYQREFGTILLSNDQTVLNYWGIAILAVPGAVFFLFAINIFKWTFQRKAYVLLTVGNVLFTVGLTIYLVLFLHWGIRGAILPVVAGNTLFGLIGLILNARYISLTPKFLDKALIKKMLAYGIPFTIVNVAGAMLPAIDRVFLVRYSTFADIGSYAIGIKIASLMSFAISSFEIAFGPLAFSIWKQQEAPGIFSRLIMIYIFITMTIAVTITGFGSILMNIFATSEYRFGIVVLPMLLMAAIFKGLLSFTLLGVYWSAKTYFNGWIAFVGICVSFMMNFLLIPWMSIIGAATALLCANVAMNAASNLISKKYYPIKVEWFRIAKVVACAVPPFALSVAEFYSDNRLISILKYCSIAAYPLFCLFVVIGKNERDSLFGYLYKVRLKIFPVSQ